MKLLHGTKRQKILTLISMAIAIALVIVAAVDISAFHTNKNQIDLVIAKDAAAVQIRQILS